MGVTYQTQLMAGTNTAQYAIIPILCVYARYKIIKIFPSPGMRFRQADRFGGIFFLLLYKIKIIPVTLDLGASEQSEDPQRNITTILHCFQHV